MILTTKLLVVLSRGMNALIQFIIILFYSSVLSTSSFGELSLLMILVALFYGLIDYGVSNTIITTRINRLIYRSCQTVNVVISLIISVLLLIIFLFFSDFIKYSEAFKESLLIFPILIIVYSLTVVPYARLHKALKLRILAVVDFIPVLSLLISVPLLIHFDFKIKTLVISLIGQVLLRFFVLKYYYGKMIRLGRLRRLPYRILFRQYSSNFVVYLTSKLDQIIVAFFLSPHLLGVYSFLKQVLNYPVSLLIAIYTQITFPTYSKLRRDVGKILSIFIKSLIILIATVLVYYLVICLIPKELVKPYIEQWDFSSQLALLMIMLSLGRVILESLSSLAIAIGLIHKQLRVNLFILLVTALSGALLPVFGVNTYVLVITIAVFCSSIYVFGLVFYKNE